MAMAWDIFVVHDREITQNAIKHPKVFRFVDCRWRNDEEIASRATHFYPENIFCTDYGC